MEMEPGVRGLFLIGSSAARRQTLINMHVLTGDPTNHHFTNPHTEVRLD
jgi:hypothetical protein